MVLYSIFLFLTAILVGGIGIAIYWGRTDLIHAYHQTNVTNKSAYGKAFGKAMLLVSMALLVSGIVGLFGYSETMAILAIAVLIIGLSIGIVCIIAVQKKYNNGIF